MFLKKCTGTEINDVYFGTRRSREFCFGYYQRKSQREMRKVMEHIFQKDLELFEYVFVFVFFLNNNKFLSGKKKYCKYNKMASNESKCSELAHLAICTPKNCNNGFPPPPIFGVKQLCASDCSISLIEERGRVRIRTNQDLGNVLFVSTEGNNNTAEIGNLHCPYRTIEAAEMDALSGSTVYVFPGTYDPPGNVLGKDGIKVYSVPGVVVNIPLDGDLITDLGRLNSTGTTGINYQWLGHATIMGLSIEPASHQRIIGIFENGTEMIFEVDKVIDLSPNTSNGFVPEAHGIVLNVNSDNLDPTNDPENKCIVRFKEWINHDPRVSTATRIFRVPFTANGQGTLIVTGDLVTSISRISTTEDAGQLYLTLQKVIVESRDPSDGTFVARNFSRSFIDVKQVLATTVASNSPVIEVGEDPFGQAHMEFTGNIVATNWGATDGSSLLRDHSVVEIGGATLVFRGSISLTRQPVILAVGIPIFRARAGAGGVRSLLDLTGTFCHNGDSTGASRVEDVGVGIIGALPIQNPDGIDVILRDTIWRVPATNAAFYNDIAISPTIQMYPLQPTFVTPSTAFPTGGIGNIFNLTGAVYGSVVFGSSLDMPTACL